MRQDSIPADRRRRKILRASQGAYLVLVMAFLLAPVVVIVLGSLTVTSYVRFPPDGLTLHWYIEAMRQTQYVSAMGVSVGVGAVAATVAMVLALCAALALHNFKVVGNHVLRVFVLTPVMLPSVVLGLAFLIMYTQLGIGNSAFGLLAAHIIAVTPFSVSLILVGMSSVDPVLERAARNLGASSWTAFRHITLPLILWAVVTGWGFAFIISFGMLEISLFLTSPKVTTLPVAIYTALEWSHLDPVLTAVASGFIIVTFVVLSIIARFLRPERLFIG